jgi:hypothetical protein
MRSCPSFMPSVIFVSRLCHSVIISFFLTGHIFTLNAYHIIPSLYLLGYVCLRRTQQFSPSSSSRFIPFLVFMEPYSYKVSSHLQKSRSAKPNWPHDNARLLRALLRHLKLTDRSHWHSECKEQGEIQISPIKTPWF